MTSAMRALALLMATAVPASAQTWVTRTQCVSNCDIPASTSSSTYGSEGGPHIAWGRMSSHATDRVKECGTNPLCMLMRAAVGYPIAFVFDAPYYAVKGVGYGLYYGAIGIGKAGKAIGRGIAYPFRDRPQPPPGSWEAYKRQILRMQKKLAKRDKASRENAKWCKGHVPLSHGPSRADWEARCNPGDIISRVSLPADVRFPNAGEASPLGLSKDVTDSIAGSVDAARQDAMVTAGMSVPVAADGAGATAAAATTPPQPSEPPPVAMPGTASSPGTESASPSPASSDPASPTTASHESVASPSATPPGASSTAEGVPSELPPSAKPTQRDVGEVLKGSDEVVKDAAQGGFDSKEAMLGAKQQGVMAAFDATAQAGSQQQFDYQADIVAAAMAPATVQTVIAAGSPETRSGAFPGALPRDAGPSDVWTYSVPTHPLLSKGGRLVGDPNRFRGSYSIQKGETCALATARQVLSEFNVTKTEDELFDFALSHGFYGSGFICNKPNPGDWCDIFYEPPYGTCRIHFTINGVDVPGTVSDIATCQLARMHGGTDIPSMNSLFQALSGRRFINDFIPFSGPGNGMKAKRLRLSSARNQVVKALTDGKAVIVSLDSRTLWNNQRLRHGLLHTVVVTAVVLDASGKVFGYYLNDTSRRGRYARFLSAADFERAWLRDHLQRMYIQ